ncbi:MAG: hypothetical protein ACJ8OJ_01300 [Povalibacter sp.]
MDDSQTRIHRYVRELDLPDRGPQFETTRTVEPPQFSAEAELIAVGPQLAEFSKSFPQELRAMLSNSLLLASLAADKANEKAGGEARDVFAWHDTYSEVLRKIGWQVQQSETQAQQVDAKNLDVHQAIIPVLTAMLGPAIAATSLVISVLNGLQDINKSSPWITLFDRSSQHSSGAKFQIGYIDANAHGDPQIALAAFAIEADRTITQVLFFKFSNQNAKLRKSATQLATTAERLRADQKVIADKVSSFIADNVSNIEI